MERIGCEHIRDNQRDHDFRHAPLEENVRRVAKAKGVAPEEITVVILDRDRHQDMIREVRGAGARVFLVTDGDVAPAIAAASANPTSRGHHRRSLIPARFSSRPGRRPTRR